MDPTIRGSNGLWRLSADPAAPSPDFSPHPLSLKLRLDPEGVTRMPSAIIHEEAIVEEVGVGDRTRIEKSPDLTQGVLSSCVQAVCELASTETVVAL